MISSAPERAFRLAQARKRPRVCTVDVPSVRIDRIFAKGQWVGESPMIHEGRFADDGATARIALIPKDFRIDAVVNVRSISGHAFVVETALNLSWDEKYGARVPRFHCQYRGCRVGVLYLIDSSFLCHKCANLTYPSQLMSPADRALKRAGALRQKHGGPPDPDLPFPPRMKGKHWSIYERDRAEALALEDEFAMRQGLAMADRIRWHYDLAVAEQTQVDQLRRDKRLPPRARPQRR